MYDGLTLAAYLDSWRDFLIGARLIDLTVLDAVDREQNRSLEESLRGGAVIVFSLVKGLEERELVFLTPTPRSGLFLWKGPLLRRQKPRSQQHRSEVSFLRQQLGGTRITQLQQYGRDRLVKLVFEGTDELGDQRELVVRILLTGRRANLLLENDGNVVFSWRGGVRYGEPFKAPPAGVSTVSEFLARRSAGEFAPKRKRTLAGELIARVDGLSGTAVEELFRRAGVDTSVAFETLNEATLTSLGEAGDKLLTEAGAVHCYPDLQVLSALPLNLSVEPQPTTEEYERQVVHYYEEDWRRRRLLELLRGEQERLASKLRKLREDIASAEKKAAGAGNLQLAGQLLLARTNVRGAAEASFELPDGTVVELNPRLSWLANAQELFKRSRRHRRALTHVDRLGGLIAAIDEEYEELVDSLKPATDIEQLSRLYIRYRKQEKPAGRGGEKLPAKVSYHKLENGLKMYWGRDGVANQYVTFRLARPGDWWFHVQQGSGAHVIIKRPDRDSQLNLDTIEVAARTAVRHSQMRTSSHVPVVYTERRYVRHRRGAPGAVFYEREKVFYVDEL
jgi:predicted ribosome quality control (RQC) complex YloA/Tae2 family protein